MRDRLEERLSPRRSASLPATITFHRSTMDCIVRNISETGAKLEVPTVGPVPNTVKLNVSGHQPQVCRVVWRSMREVGVKFIESSAPTLR